MSGIRLFLDTNAIIAIVSGNEAVIQLCSHANWIGTSSICVIEFLAFPKLTFDDRLKFASFIKRIETIEVSKDLAFLEAVALFKKEHNLKLPDAIIAGYAVQLSASLVTNDKHFYNIRKLNVLNFELP